MRFFFRSRQFRVILCVVSVVLAVAVAVGVIGGVASPSSNVFGAVVAPVQSAFHRAVGAVKGFFASVGDNAELIQENRRLQSEVNRLTEESVQNEEAVRENEFYKDYLEIKDRNPDFQFQPASVIAEDPNDPYGGFVINRGSVHSVALYDPVITDAGLVGYVTEVALSYAKVTTLLSGDIRVGAKDSRTGDVGVVTGRLDTAKAGQTGMYNLARSSSVTVGDHIVTNGGGIFPGGLLIGTISEVRAQETDISVYAVLDPAVDFEQLNDVMVLTYFSGQGTEEYDAGGGQ